MKKVEVDAKLLIMVISLVLVATVGASYTTYLVFSGDGEPFELVGGSQVSGEEIADPVEFGPIHEIGDFTVNVPSADGYRSKYLRISLSVELDAEATAQELEKRNVQIRDTVVRVLRGETLESVSTVEGAEKLRAKLCDEINGVIYTGRVKSVYFTEFVTQ